MRSVPAKLALLMSTSLWGLVAGQKIDVSKQAPLDNAAFKIGIPLNPVDTTLASVTEIDPLAEVPPFDLFEEKPWGGHTAIIVQYYEDGSIHTFLENESKVKMNVIKLCGNGFDAPNLYWKGGITGAHVHQDNNHNQKQFVAGVVQPTERLLNGSVVQNYAIEIMTERTSAACGAVSPSWRDNGNWGKLGDIIDHFIALWVASKDTCSLLKNSVGGKGLQCGLPCDPISPMWLSYIGRYVRQTRRINGKQLYSPVYMLSTQFNKGDDNGGLTPTSFLNAQCGGDDLTFREQGFDVPTYVTFWH